MQWGSKLYVIPDFSILTFIGTKPLSCKVYPPKASRSALHWAEQ